MNEARPTRLMDVIRSFKKARGIEKMLSLNYLDDGIVSLMRFEDGNAYEIVVRPAANAKHKWAHKHLTDPS